MKIITYNGSSYISLEDYNTLLEDLLKAKDECDKLRNPFYKAPKEKPKTNQQHKCKIVSLYRTNK